MSLTKRVVVELGSESTLPLDKDLLDAEDGVFTSTGEVSARYSALRLTMVVLMGEMLPAGMALVLVFLMFFILSDPVTGSEQVLGFARLLLTTLVTCLFLSEVKH